jgi:nucleoside-diphosphate-sugar epimerase
VKVLVTGASGFTGGALCRYLVERGHEVRALVRHSSDLSGLDGLPVELAYADLRDDPVEAAVRGIDILYHVAALFRAEGVGRRVFWDVNVGGTRKLLQAATESGIERFVYVSTVGVQGHIEHPPADEAYRMAPGDHYQASKQDAELLALEHHRETGLPLAVVRPAGIYGPGDLRFLKLFRSIRSGRFRMIGKGDVHYHFTYADDLVRGIVRAAEVNEAVGEVFTVAGAEPVTLNDLVRLIARILGCPEPRQRLYIPVFPVWLAGLLCESVCRPLGIEPPLFRRRVDFFVKNRSFDIGKARRVLGYEPQVSLADGMRRTAAWYAEQGLL